MNHKKIATRADEMAYHALQKAIADDKLRVYLDYGKVNRPQSPVYNPWESLLPILLPILLGLILIISVGVLFGLLFMIAMILVYAHVVKKMLYQRIIKRSKDYIISGYENCCELWNFGGVILVNADNKKVGCIAPEGDWKEFVVVNFSDLMLDKTEDGAGGNETPPQ